MQPYQYQIDDVLFGRGTGIIIQKVEPQPHVVETQDFKLPRTNEIRFGIDTLSAGPIMFMLSILVNWQIGKSPNDIVSDDLFAKDGTLLPKLAKAWLNNKELMMTWGAAIPLKVCNRYGEVFRIYGRPGKFAQSMRRTEGQAWIDVMAEFRRMDTLAHSDTEYFVGPLNPGAAAVVATRFSDDADAWVRVLVTGPATNPIITYGDEVIEFAGTVPAGQTLEISSYPWLRRVVRDTGSILVSERASLVGDTQYLDQIVFKEGDSINVSWTASATTGTSKLHFAWRETQNVV
jgi:hypothetical protein